VLDSFIKTSATGGLGSIKAEVMADTAVALASGNVKLVSSKVSSLFALISFYVLISTYIIVCTEMLPDNSVQAVMRKT